MALREVQNAQNSSARLLIVARSALLWNRQSRFEHIVLVSLINRCFRKKRAKLRHVSEGHGCGSFSFARNKWQLITAHHTAKLNTPCRWLKTHSLALAPLQATGDWFPKFLQPWGMPRIHVCSPERQDFLNRGSSCSRIVGMRIRGRARFISVHELGRYCEVFASTRPCKR